LLNAGSTAARFTHLPCHAGQRPHFSLEKADCDILRGVRTGGGGAFRGHPVQIQTGVARKKLKEAGRTSKYH
jgi:hypothetical protein